MGAEACGEVNIAIATSHAIRQPRHGRFAYAVTSEGEQMTAARLQELQEMAAKLLATAGELPPGQDHHNALREIDKFRAKIATLQGVGLRSAQQPPRQREPSGQ
jgi:hypothetical protein